MLDTLRKPFFVIAVVVLAITIAVEFGSNRLLFPTAPPGRGIPYLGVFDLLLLYTIAVMGLALVVSQGLHGRVQGIATLVFSFIMLLSAIGMVIAAFTLLILMVALLLSPIFGTLAYLAGFGDFDRSSAGAILSATLFLKLLFVACLLAAQQRFIANRRLIALLGVSIVLTIVLSFLHNLVPGILVSITDDIGAIVIGVLVAVWSIYFLIGSIGATVKAIA